ncbi:hypothetical protein HN937_23835, partial [Candidatus Poribacteria bacterium]|nr:hypothetical protein [Candidatus Poribacteria bacterium]
MTPADLITHGLLPTAGMRVLARVLYFDGEIDEWKSGEYTIVTPPRDAIRLIPSTVDLRPPLYVEPSADAFAALDEDRLVHLAADLEDETTYLIALAACARRQPP